MLLVTSASLNDEFQHLAIKNSVFIIYPNCHQLLSLVQYLSGNCVVAF